MGEKDMKTWSKSTLFAGALMLTPAAHGAEFEKSLSLPPPSLAQWYKPVNPRQVWLHNMFNLRREMQASTEYIEAGDLVRGEKWIKRLIADYGKIADMVPEWKDELLPTEADRLLSALNEGDIDQLSRSIRKIENSCKSCHREFRAVTAMLYRTPDFSKIRVGSEGAEGRSFAEAMNTLSLWVNRIKIASEDGLKSQALEALAELESGLSRLGDTCVECHRDETPKERILGALTLEALRSVGAGLEQGDEKQTARSLGSAAVYACARCHAVHRTTYEMKQSLAPKH